MRGFIFSMVCAENSIACAVMISWFIAVDGKQPRNPQKFETSKLITRTVCRCACVYVRMCIGVHALHEHICASLPI